MAASSAPSSSSSSLSAAFSPKKYDVFISFRGEDTRCKFVSHLYAALQYKSIKTFIDNQLHKGDEISPALLKAIESSSASIVVFSENYAFSSWCLDELAKILECRKDQGQVVIPVFYEVDPSHVRNHTESYKRAFTKHERDLRHNKDKVHKWKAALTEAANLAGWDSRMCRDESRLIQNIVNDVLQKLHYMYPYELKGLVGVDENCKCVELLLQKAPTVGIWGMGGMGKTTIAKVVFAKLSCQYEGCCFLENVREESDKRGLKYLRDKLLHDLLKEEPQDLLSSFLFGRLESKKVLIVLDDVNSFKQLDYLADIWDSLHPCSKVIITSRDKQVLINRVDNRHIHKIKELSFEDSLKLFCNNAFKKNHPKIDYKELSERAVEYTNRLPLALKILGASFHCKSRDMWESALDKLKKYPNGEIRSVLRLSYDDLDDLEKKIFLDIAFFWRGEDKEVVKMVLDACGFNAASGIGRLLDKALITISSYNHTIQMHDLIQEIGLEIVRQESSKYPERRSRLRDIEEVYDVLKNNKGTDLVEGIMLDLSQSRDLQLSADTLKKMTNLRIIIFFSSKCNRICNVHLPINLEFPDQLRYLEWYGYPLESLPSTFSPEKLVELCMADSCVKKLWNGVQNLVNLRNINLRGAKQLMELPDFSKASNLEVMDLSFCVRLYHVHSSIFSLPRLAILRLMECTRLQSLQRDVHFKSLEHLDVHGCSSLKEFSISSPEMRELDLWATEIEICHLSAEHLINLEHLTLSCLKLKNLPSELLSCLTSLTWLELSNCGELINNPELQILFDALRSLETLILRNCYNLFELPGNISNLQSLFLLELSDSNVESLPSSIKHLSELRELTLSDCLNLGSLPELPPTIRRLDTSNCISLETIPLLTSLAQRHISSKFRIEYFRFENCLSLNENSLWAIMKLAHFGLKLALHEHLCNSSNDCLCPRVCLPGNQIPEWFPYQKTESSVTFQLSVSSHSPLLGFIFGIALSSGPSSWDLMPRRIKCEYSLDYEETSQYKHEVTFHLRSMAFYVNNVYLCCSRSTKELDRIIKRSACDESITHNPRVSFEFLVECLDENFELEEIPVRGCGVCPVYASEYPNIIKQMGLELELERNRAIEMVAGSFGEMQISRKFIIPSTPMGTNWKNRTQGLKDIVFL